MASSADNGKKGKKRKSGDILFRLTPIPGPNTDIKSWGVDPALVTHGGIFCKGPQCTGRIDFIHGIRYKCSTCPNIDFCDACMQDPDNSHDRSHEFWPCYGQSLFEDDRHMSPEELGEVREAARDVREEYVIVPQQGPEGSSSVESRAHPLNMEEWRAHLFGTNNQIADDQLLDHWKNGIPAVLLIDLLPGNRDDILNGYFISTRLDKPEPYDVLCCDWVPPDTDNPAGITNEGELDFPAVVCIGQHCVSVKKATADALRTLRSEDEVVKLWVEELCVQQQHAEFKAFQERSTSLIYNRAARTIVWAGHEDANTESAWTLIEILSHREDGNHLSPAHLEHDPGLEELGLLPVGSDKWKSLVKFFPPHLFTQGWLLHDVAFASKAIVKCGIYDLEWWQVARVRNMLAQPSWKSLNWPRPT